MKVPAILVILGLLSLCTGGCASDRASSTGSSPSDATSRTLLENEHEAVPSVTKHTIDAYIPLGGARDVETVVRFTDGAAVVTILGRGQTIEVLDGRRQATEENLEEFAAAGKPVELGQEIGPTGIPVTPFRAQVDWFDGISEVADLAFTGGLLDGIDYELGGIPLPDVGDRYVFFLRRSELGLVAEAIQFDLAADDRLEARTFPHAPVSKDLAGSTVAEIRDSVQAAYNEAAARLPDGVRPSE